MPILLHYKNAEFYEQTNATNSMKKYVPVPKIFALVWRGSGQTPPLALLGGAKRLGHTKVKYLEDTLLTVPKLTTDFFRRSFSYSAPVIWNSLPSNILLCNSDSVFWKHLKTFLFSAA